MDSTWQDCYGYEVSPVSHFVGRVLLPTYSRVYINVLPRYRWPTRRPRFHYEHCQQGIPPSDPSRVKERYIRHTSNAD